MRLLEIIAMQREGLRSGRELRDRTGGQKIETFETVGDVPSGQDLRGVLR